VIGPEQLRYILWSAIAIMAAVAPFAIFAHRVFSLPRASLAWILAMHCARSAAGLGAMALVWSLGAPSVPVTAWIVLVALRMLVSRLPFLPNNDLVFANFAILLIGHSNPVAWLVAVTIGLKQVLHGVTFALLAGVSLFGMKR